MARRDTREHIVDVAIRLFNESGTAAVSTNHIAAAAGISPGNLYYHFHNKEEIVLSAYERAIGAYDSIWQRAIADAPSPSLVMELLDATFEVQWEYRFLQRELSWLVQADPAIGERFREVEQRRLRFLRTLFDAWVSAGVARPLPGTELDDLITAVWVVGDQWIAYLQATGAGSSRDDVRRGSRLIFEILKPHLVEPVQTAG